MNEKKFYRVGIYLRLSDEDQNKKNKLEVSESIKNQRHLLLEEIARRKDFKLVDEYCDEDLSGAGTFRPEFERLISDCEKGKLDIVLCKSQSRFSRDMEIIEKYLHNKFIEWNIRFISFSDNADTANIGNKKARQINGLVNEWYLEDVSNNIRSAFQSKMKVGEYISPFAPFGYEISKIDNNKLVIDLEASMIVQEIFHLYLSGLGFKAIANYLNQNSIPSPSFYKYQKGINLNIISNKSREEIKWSANAIKTILTNEVYIGNLVQGKRTTISYKNHKIRKKTKAEWIKVENTHPAIIEKSLFEKVQLNLKDKAKPIKKNGVIHNFSGKVFCLECQHILRKKNSSTHEYLVCSSSQNNINSCSNKHSIRYDRLEKIILNTINQKLKKFYNIDKLKNLQQEDNYLHSKSKILERKKTLLTAKLSHTKNYLKCLYEDKVNNIITEEQFNELIKDYSRQVKLYKTELQDINQKISLSKLEYSNNIFNEYQSFQKLNKIIVDSFIEKIWIGTINTKEKEREIKIQWNFH